jgi:hypothetical protein
VRRAFFWGDGEVDLFWRRARVRESGDSKVYLGSITPALSVMVFAGLCEDWCDELDAVERFSVGRWSFLVPLDTSREEIS